jgi:glutaminyl-peptide cyclotransferase
MKNHILLTVTALVLLYGCTGDEKKQEHTTTPEPQPAKVEKLKSPDINSDSTYSFIEKQLAFGPRVPGTEGWKKCGAWIQAKLKQYGCEVTVQNGQMEAFNGKILPVMNIMGSINKSATNRVLLFTHWDSRPWADSDTINENKPIPGANDGASGVAVLLEMARTIALAGNKPSIGVDFLMVDAEDYGQPNNTMLPPKEDTWCLGTQYWAKHKPADYKPMYGILLDMVGAKDAIFPIEGKSASYAPSVVNKVWNTAQRIGYGNFFVKETIDFVGSDDHVYMNRMANIPSIDIIQFDPRTGSFGDYHHTHHDDINIIDKTTLKAVGQTVMEVVYSEQ